MTDGGLIGPAARMHLGPADDPACAPLTLAGTWRFQAAHNFGPQPGPMQPFGRGNQNTPHILYDSMILPLAPAAFRGAIWYQGESNATVPAHYRTLFPLMIRDWRRTFAREFPFYFVQLANHTLPQQQPSEGGWAMLREAQLLTLREPDTGMAVAIDIGEADDIHPRNKQDVGKRLALIAKNRVYGQTCTYSGPLYRSHDIENDAIRLHFDHGDGGLTVRSGELGGFAIAGDDRVFVWAVAAIDGDSVRVSSPAVPRPVAVRYGWASNPVRANLYNAAGLPASPFRTDDW